MPYHHLTQQERYVISHMTMAGFSQAQIARRLGRDRGTISRELRRNTHPYDHTYFYDVAQDQAQRRRTQANQRYRLATGQLGEVVRDRLRQTWSPEQIAGRLQQDYPDDPDMHVSHETIYQWVYRHHAQGWHQHLRRRRPRRRPRIPNRIPRGLIRDRVGIEQRPKIVERRKRFGDWEADTVEGAKGTGGLATHVERRSRYLLAGKLSDKRADTYARTTTRLYRDLPASLRRTITGDNGKEFAQFKTIERQLKVRVYFARPYAAWERGTNENTNGLLREFFPKGSDFTKVSHHQVARATKLLNNRPRKCLNYRTPAQVLSAIPGVALRN